MASGRGHAPARARPDGMAGGARQARQDHKDALGKGVQAARSRAGAQRPGSRARRAPGDHLSRGPDHAGADGLADHGDVLRRPRPQQRDGPGVLLLARASVPLRRDDPRRDLDRRARHPLPACGRRRSAQVADPRSEGDPGRLRRRDHRPDHARHRRPDRLHLAPATASRSASTRSTRRRTCCCSSAACSSPRPASARCGPSRTSRSTSRASLPVLLSTTLFIGVAGFITMYLSAFMTNVTPTSDFVHDYQDALQGRLHDDQTVSLNAGPDRLRRRPAGPTTTTRPATGSRRDHHDARPARPDPAAAAPLARAVRRDDADLPRLRAAREHHDRVPRHRADHPADRSPASRSTSCSSVARSADGRLTLGGIRTVGPAAAAVLWISYYTVLALDKGIGWEPTLWVGALMVGIDDRLRRRVPGRAAVLRPAPRRSRRLEVLL